MWFASFLLQRIDCQSNSDNLAPHLLKLPWEGRMALAACQLANK